MLQGSVELIRKFSKSVKKPPKMVIRHHVEGYEEFVKFMEKFQGDGVVHVLFSGTKSPDGKSWCPDCVEGNFQCRIFMNFIIENAHYITSK